jgi:zinc transporter ZupT
MYEFVKTAFTVPRNAITWAVLTLALAVAGAVSGYWVLVIVALFPAFQWGFAGAVTLYERGITCAECDERLVDGDNPPSVGL